MDSKFLMGSEDWLERTNADDAVATNVSPGLRRSLVKAAIQKAVEFYRAWFAVIDADVASGTLADEYEHAYAEAVSLGLFEAGGVGEKDHLNFWCLGRVFAPQVYVESGVFIGSSLHAFIGSSALQSTVAIDPDLTKLKVPTQNIPGARLIDDEDFSQVTFDLAGMSALAYFDDHIDAASRIVQAHDKGFKHLLFDDATGVEGVCQRLYPAVPTLPMIMHAEMLSPGEALTWYFPLPVDMRLRARARRLLTFESAAAGMQVRLPVTQALVDRCFQAKGLISKCEMIPDLGEFIPQRFPRPMVDTSKYIVTLR